MKQTTSPIPVDVLRQILRYDPETGKLFWMVRLNGHIKAGDEAGTTKDGRRFIKWRGKSIQAYRIGWALSYGEWPALFVDHINGVCNDDRLANLRLATKEQSAQNMPLSKRNTTGFKGVIFDRRHGTYHAKIFANGKLHWLGRFTTAQDAHAAYCAKAREVHGEFARF